MYKYSMRSEEQWIIIMGVYEFILGCCILLHVFDGIVVLLFF
jgi:uncharacterized membrane protein HdeD (DUF308 family)